MAMSLLLTIAGAISCVVLLVSALFSVFLQLSSCISSAPVFRELADSEPEDHRHREAEALTHGR